jgi:hypothetical protein
VAAVSQRMPDEVTPPALCIVCRAEPAAVERICESCSEDITASIGLLPQQILATCVRPTGDALVDQWGRAHPLQDRTLIGRALEGAGLLILECSVSRHHAHLARDGQSWRLRDLASINGTFVNDEAVDSVVLAHGDRIAVGAVRFYLVLGIGDIPPPPFDAAAITTVRSRPISADPGEPSLGPIADTDAPVLLRAETTDVRLPVVDIRIAESAGGGGGVLQVGQVSIQLSTNQTRLVALLANRMLAEVEQPSFVRGFVRSSELLGSLAWDSPDPDDNHVKQLIRRTRRQLVRAGLGDLIEARQRFGYRLRLVPRDG